MAIRCEFTLSLDELTQLQKDFIPRSADQKKTKWTIYSVISLIMLMVVRHGHFALPLLFIFFSLLIGFPLIYNRLAIWSVNQYISQNVTPEMLEPTEVVISEEGIDR